MPQKGPRCIKCGSRKTIAEYEHWLCTSCGASFDDDPEEGGDYSTDPTRRLQQQEAARERRQQPRRRF